MSTDSQTAEAPTPTTTKTVREWWRSMKTWLVIGAGVLILAILTLAISSTSPARTSPLDPASPYPEGAKALVEVLKSDGVAVSVANSLDAAQSADSDATLVVVDLDARLSELDFQALLDAGPGRIVLVQPTLAAMRAYSDVFTVAGSATATEGGTIAVGDQCDDPLARNAPQISAVDSITFTPQGDATGCYAAGGGDAVVVGETQGVGIVALGPAALLTNDAIADYDNAALALGLLGDEAKLVWFDASTSAQAAPSPQDFVPPQLTPTLLLGLAVAIGVMVWRGRRFGPLVTERLPVTVPANETVEGRARLYAQAGARMRSLDALRIGALRRMSETLKLPGHASVYEVADAAAAAVGMNRDQARWLLLDARPQADSDFVQLAADISQLETSVRGTVNPDAERLQNQRAKGSA